MLKALGTLIRKVQTFPADVVVKLPLLRVKLTGMTEPKS